MHSNILANAGFSGLVATALAHGHHHWRRAISSDSSVLSLLQSRDIEDVLEETLSIRDIVEIGSELLARAYGSDEADVASYASLSGRALRSHVPSSPQMSKFPTSFRGHEYNVDPYLRSLGQASHVDIGRRDVYLDDMEYGLYIRDPVGSVLPPSSRASAAKSSVGGASAGRGSPGGTTANTGSANRAAAGSNKASGSSGKKNISKKIGSGLGKVGKVANSVATVGNQAGNAANGIGNAANSVAGAVKGVGNAGSAVGNLVETGLDLFSSIFKREALALALAHAEAETEADPELDIWADDLYESYAY